MMLRIFFLLLASASAFSINSRRAFVEQAAIGGASWLVQSSVVGAYDRDIGGESRSPEQAAYNIQAKATNARLESSGFKLDTKEEESSRLSDALGSYSYSSSGSGKSSKKTNASSKSPEKKK
mmetsp:Transcript_17973/g.29749  ORF Transcript_17973/g.29749 Transcript_17973/m.29749 type:complete len:122 (+) Transcript_17973:75-440(+)|eukprot:CAMPEP_0119009580 /NCGR_PEP_ID=MMETSP1176-20130426/4467_1 /TAXON_ID=265551 /ORGANISM="Synedropsis recta cf, Strain CCMP1620" /LENGTH=121 /DNA_ID=CAMNT_0006962123 /DNA_START=48 /DNA_END=413 /DNA_ORIENTATION=-